MWCGVGVKTDCLTKDLGLQVEYLPWGVFLRDPSSYFREFRRKPRETPNGTLLEILDYFAQKNGANLLAIKDGAQLYNILVFRYAP